MLGNVTSALGNVNTAGQVTPVSSGGGGGFPGFGTADEPVGPATGGAAATAARADHQHPFPQVADAAALAALLAATWEPGSSIYVVTLKSWFRLEPSTQTAVALERIAANGKAGYLWIRDPRSPAWWSQTAWEINPATGNNEATGAPGSPLASWQEFERRRRFRKLPLAETYNTTVTIVGDLPDTDFVYDWASGRRPNSSNALTINGTPVVVATFTITAATAINRATGTRNTITATGLGAHVGRIVRLQATPTTTAVIEKAISADEVALSEQSVAGALGGGFTNGQVVEVVSGSKIPGAYFGYSDNLVTFNDCDFDPGIGMQIATDMGGVSSAINFNRCRFRGTTTNQITTPSMTFVGCAFVDRQSNLRGRTTLNICGQVAQTGLGISITNTDGSECTMLNHTSQRSQITLGEGTYFHVSGGGGGAGPGIFDMLEGGQFFVCLNASHLSDASMWGGGNDAASIPINLGIATFSRAAGASAFAATIGGVGLRMLCGGVVQDVPLAELPHNIAAGQQPGALVKFSGGLETDAVLPTVAYMADTGSAFALAAAGGPLPPQRYATSERLALRLRATILNGAVPTPIVVTLYKGNVATTMQVTFAALSPQYTKAVDSAHPILFLDGEDFDIRLSNAGGDTAANFEISAVLEFAT